ncbi:MAG: general secretion pathway protein GspB, partial [Gammaproteobacteria bacterium]|nr:general secretion pathway protein GspB [Gammaproteobacteria bacterium]
ERAPAPAPSPAPPVQAVPLAAVPAPALPEPPRPAPVVAVGDVVSLDDVIAAPTEAVPAAPAATVETVPAEAAPAVAQESAVSAAEEPEPPAAEGGEEADVERGEPQPAAPPAPAPRPHGGVPRLRDMPAGYRADFPNLNVDVHVYQRDPQRRFVLINGRRYKEGEQLAEGPLVVQIVENGIVLDYRGERVLYPAAQ